MADSDEEYIRDHRSKFNTERRTDRPTYSTRSNRYTDRKRPYNQPTTSTTDSPPTKRSADPSRYHSGRPTTSRPTDDHRPSGRSNRDQPAPLRNAPSAGDDPFLEPDYPTQPSLLSFRRFMELQNDSMDEDEALKLFRQYKTQFKQTQISDFFTHHKEEEWFKLRYHPNYCVKFHEENGLVLAHRLDCFMELFQAGFVDQVKCDYDYEEQLTKLLDSAIILLEGGTMNDLKVLDVKNSDVDFRPFRTEAEKLANDKRIKKEMKARRKSTESSNVFGSGSESSSSDSESTNSHSSKELDKKIKKTESGRPLHKTKSIFLRSLPPSFSRNELENYFTKFPGFRRLALQEPQAERKFLRRGWATFTNQTDVAEICQRMKNERFNEFDMGAIVNRDLRLRVRPVNGVTAWKRTAKKDLRLAVELVKSYDQKWAIWELRSKKLRKKKSEVESPSEKVENSTVKVEKSNDKMENSIEKMENSDEKTEISGEKMEISDEKTEISDEKTENSNEKTEKSDENMENSEEKMENSDEKMEVENSIKTEPEIVLNGEKDEEKTSEMKKPTNEPNDQPDEKEKPIEKNPVLIGLEKHLGKNYLEKTEANWDDDDDNSNEKSPNSGQIPLERDEQLLAALDRIILYLRIVYSVDFYQCNEYPNEHEMPHRCGIMHARGNALSQPVSSSYIDRYVKDFAEKFRPLLVGNLTINEKELPMLGLKTIEEEIEKYKTASSECDAKGRWKCKLHGKLFKGREFLEKHLENFHAEQLKAVQLETEFFNNYALDRRRPMLPEHPSTKIGGNQAALDAASTSYASGLSQSAGVVGEVGPSAISTASSTTTAMPSLSALSSMFPTGSMPTNPLAAFQTSLFAAAAAAAAAAAGPKMGTGRLRSPSPPQPAERDFPRRRQLNYRDWDQPDKDDYLF